MAQASTAQERIDDTHKDYAHIYRYMRGFALVGIGIWIGISLFGNDDGYWTNVFTEFIGIVATYFIFDEITKRSAKQELKTQLLADLKSSSLSPAVNALDRLRRDDALAQDYLQGKNFERANWEGAYIGGLNFDHARLQDVNFKTVTNRTGEDYLPVSFKGAELYKANLSGANLGQANLSDATLRLANLSGANLFLANLSGADLWKTNLSDADLSEANLSGAYLRLANLSGANLGKANLSGANLGKANLSGANLGLANLDNVKWASSLGTPATLPDGRQWRADTDMERFRDSNHPEYQSTLAIINAIREQQGR